ncbi:uncharacterized protein HD556DRAFT_1303970 [Suillus plorans]|uniref:Myb/SANT-like domain-containing protein n=1 Tax=Suillus plorans TaxID=116603 RepID=A0A9P7DTP8_9AGAM|nr:uncharacterized protein HD556DRAFT_1303970 [Suillus plorans]KAG1802675.1 hypothetical protein HD556DRAFT_1303970 [Suillus plorans]
MDYTTHLSLERRQRLFAGALAITATCAQYTTLLMAQPEVHQARVPHAQWNDGEITALINYLYDHRSDAEGGGNFKTKVLADAADHINSDEDLAATRMGPPKTAKSVRNKWTLLKSTYHAIEKYCNQTGVHWGNENGGGIAGPAATAVWESYIQKNPLIWPFRTKGWEHYVKMQAIIPLGGARGRHAFCPGGVATPITNPDTEPGGTSDAAVPAGAVAGPSGSTTTDPHPTATAITSGSGSTSTTTTTTTTTTTSTAATSAAATSAAAASSAATSNAGKRPHTEADMETMSFGSSHISMQPPSTTLVVSGPPSKKARTPAQSQNSHHTKISSIARAAKITPAAAVVGMQGSINQMTDSFEAFMRGAVDDDNVTRAVRLLEGEDADIPPEQQALLRQEMCVCREDDRSASW